MGAKLDGKINRSIHKVLRKLAKKYGLKKVGRDKACMYVDILHRSNPPPRVSIINTTTTMADQLPPNPDHHAKKKWIPLENNPTVLTPLAHGLGLPTTYALHDVYALTPDLLAFIPRPAHALIALIPSAVWRRTRLTEPNAGSASVTPAAATGSPDGRQPLWFKQTIGNACGLYALLHALGNGALVPTLLAGGGEAARLVRAAHTLESVEARSEVLEESAELERLHGAAALRGDTVAPSAEEEPGHHFMCFVKGVDGRLWELEGAWKGPIELGQLGEDEDVLSEKALELGVKRFLKHADEGEVNFSLTALAPVMD